MPDRPDTEPNRCCQIRLCLCFLNVSGLPGMAIHKAELADFRNVKFQSNELHFMIKLLGRIQGRENLKKLQADAEGKTTPANPTCGLPSRALTRKSQAGASLVDSRANR